MLFSVCYDFLCNQCVREFSLKKPISTVHNGKHNNTRYVNYVVNNNDNIQFEKILRKLLKVIYIAKITVSEELI